MNKIKISLFTALVLIGTVLGACQSDGDKVAQTDNNYPAKLTDVQTQKDKEVQEQIRQYVEETPDLYKISWKVCGDWNASTKTEQGATKPKFLELRDISSLFMCGEPMEFSLLTNRILSEIFGLQDYLYNQEGA